MKRKGSAPGDSKDSKARKRVCITVEEGLHVPSLPLFVKDAKDVKSSSNPWPWVAIEPPYVLIPISRDTIDDIKAAEAESKQTDDGEAETTVWCGVVSDGQGALEKLGLTSEFNADEVEGIPLPSLADIHPIIVSPTDDTTIKNAADLARLVQFAVAVRCVANG